MIERIHHIGVVVRDIDPALNYFRDTLGLPFEVREYVESQGVEAVFLGIGRSHIELIRPTVPDSGISKFLANRGEGLHHVCFEVPDVAAELLRLKNLGVQVIDETPRPGVGGPVGFMHPRALHGVLVEFITEIEGVPKPVASSENPLGIQKVDHLAFLVADINAAAADWRRVLQLPVARVLDYSQGRGFFLGQIPIGETTIELLAPSGPDTEFAARLSREGEGMGSTVAVEVKDLAQAVDLLRARGVEVSDPRTGTLEGTRVAIASREAGHGVTIQLLERVSQ
jgi:methylmalonyl-CoA/ethylmalonyl-CoA epimerase